MDTYSLLFDELSRIQKESTVSMHFKKIQVDWRRRVKRPDIQPSLIDETFVESVLALRLQGNSYSKIASKLNREGSRAIRGGRWYGPALNIFMKNKCCEFLCEWPKQLPK